MIAGPHVCRASAAGAVAGFEGCYFRICEETKKNYTLLTPEAIIQKIIYKRRALCFCLHRRAQGKQQQIKKKGRTGTRAAAALVTPPLQVKKNEENVVRPQDDATSLSCMGAPPDRTMMKKAKSSALLKVGIDWLIDWCVLLLLWVWILILMQRSRAVYRHKLYR